jgi:hypothetical protein
MSNKSRGPGDKETSDKKRRGVDPVYGRDSCNLLLWRLLDLRDELEMCRRGIERPRQLVPLVASVEPSTPSSLETLLRKVFDFDDDAPSMADVVELVTNTDAPRESLALDLFNRARRSGDYQALRFFDDVAKAILGGNADFFREVARLIEQRIHGDPVERRVDVAVNQAFWELLLATRALPTKKQVRERAIYRGRLMRRQKWAEVFKRCRLSKLPNAKSGRPRKKRS